MHGRCLSSAQGRVLEARDALMKIKARSVISVKSVVSCFYPGLWLRLCGFVPASRRCKLNHAGPLAPVVDNRENYLLFGRRQAQNLAEIFRPGEVFLV